MGTKKCGWHSIQLAHQNIQSPDLLPSCCQDQAWANYTLHNFVKQKKTTCASTKINTVPYQDYRDLDVCQLTKQRVFLKKRESVKELLLGLVLNEPTHISKFFAISRDTSCPHFFLHNLHCSWWFTLSCRTCLSWWFW